jgi:3-oxoacyl-[acyl-carrier protein] reductase
MTSEGTKVVAISGAAGGIGAAVARHFASEGAVLSLHDRNAAALSELATALADADVLTTTGDVSRKPDVVAWIDRTMERFGRIDVLVNAAGIRSNGSAQGLDEAEWDRVLDINLKGVFLCCQAVMHGMKARNAGRIINIGSVLGKNSGNARPWIDTAEQDTSSNLAYGAAKAGVHAMTGYLARELARFNVTVNTVAPGPVTSPMTANSPASRRAMIPMGRYATVDEVAHAVAFLASAEAGYITGETLDVNGGLWSD